jgi:hypothetical protein
MTAILQSNLETDLRLASSLAANLRVLLADQASLRTSGAVTFLGSVNGSLTDTLSERFAGLDGYDAFAAASSEASDESSTAMTDASASIAVARMVIRRDISDLAVLTGNGAINPRRLAASMVGEYEQGFNQLVADAIDDASTDVGSSGVDASISDFFDAIFQLELNSVPGPYFAILHPRQVADLQESLRAEGGAVQYMPATAEMLMAKGQGYAGSLLGVDIHKISKVNSAGGNRHGCMLGLGALGYRVGIVEEVIGSTVIRADEFVVEFERDASKSTTEIVGSSYLGVGIIEQARIVGIVTDA